MPKRMSSSDTATPNTANPLDQIHEAKEIRMHSATASARVATRPASASAVPGWYHAAIPIMFTLGSLLFLISIWAVIASVCTFFKIESPFVTIPPPPEEGEVVPLNFWTYIPYIMLLCLPVSLTLAVMAIIMKRQILKFQRASAK